MVQGDPSLPAILDGAMFLSEQLASDAACGESGDGTLRDRRLARWQDRLGGRVEALDRRIESAGWSRAAVEAVLSGGRRRDAVSPVASKPPPEWLALLERILARSPDQTIAPDLSALPFGELFTGLIAVARETLTERLTRRAAAVASDRALRGLEFSLAESIASVLSRCLLAEFDAVRPGAPAAILTLTGGRGDAFGDRCYRTFVARQRADNLRGVFTRYPVAARLVATDLAMWAETSAEFLDRLARDLPEIRRRLPGAGNNGSADVVAVSRRLGDPHEHGRSVAIVTFADGGKVVYKPRSLAPEAAWSAFTATIGSPCGDLAAKVVDRGEYGWMEFVPRRDLANRDAARAFYRSAGAMLCLARALAMNDLHFENVVAAGDRLVPVDLETIAQPPRHSAARTPLERIEETRDQSLEDCVRETQALPARYSLTNRPPRDISALADVRTNTRRRPAWRGLGTDAIVHLFEEEPVAAGNLPRIDGAVVLPDDYGDEIVAGFTAAWKALGRARDQLMAPGGFIDRLATVPVRHIRRATEIYYGVLATAVEPEAMRCGVDFSIELEVLYRSALGEGPSREVRAVVDAEVGALQRGDIPRFSMPAGTRRVFSEGNPILDDAVPRSGVETVQSRLSKLGTAELAAELRFIRASFHAARHGKSTKPVDPLALRGREPFPADQALAAAIGIGREILEGAMPRADGGASWIGVAYREDAAGPAVVAANESLYEGTAGIGLFLAALYRVTAGQVWREAADRAFVGARRLARETLPEDAIVSTLGLGLGGIGGLIYALALASALLEDPSLLADAASLAARIDANAVSDGRDTDVLAGLAGTIPGLLALAGTDLGATAGDVALSCARAIIERTGGDLSSLPAASADGYGHGVPGTLATLALLADRDADTRNLVARASTESVAAGTNPCGCGEAAVRRPAGWCKGPIGVSLARLAVQLRTGEASEDAVAAVEQAVDAATDDHQTLDQVCCGLFGGVEALLIAAGFGRPDLRDKAGRLAGAVLARARRAGGFRLLAGLPPGYASPGFFQGTSGIGYTLLRIARPGLLPSIVLTEWRT